MKRNRLFVWIVENKTLRLFIFSILAIVLAIILTNSLINYTNINLDTLLEIILRFPLWGLLLVLVMTLMNLVIGSYKWKLVVEHLSKNVDTKPPYFFYLLNTSLGAFLGLVVPVQVSTLGVRSISLRVGGYGSLGKGAFTSLISQIQDVLIILFFFLPGILMLLMGTNETLWYILIILLCVGGYVFIKYFASRLVSYLNSLLYQFNSSRSILNHGIKVIQNVFNEIVTKDLLNPTLTIPLYFLSFLRFINLAGRSYIISLIIGLDVAPILIISLSSIVQLSLLIAITPGNLGLVEWGWVGLLSLIGVLTSDAGQFALTSRILDYSSTIIFFVGLGCISLIKNYSTNKQNVKEFNTK